MTDIAKGVLAGSWSLLAGWILPAGLGVVVIGFLVMPSFAAVPAVQSALAAKPSDQALILLAAAVVIGLTLASVATPLYRVLEGYLLWPERLQVRGRTKHQNRRQKAEDDLTALARPGAPLGLKAGLAKERLGRYPDDPEQVAPTRLGNAIRRFEYYSYDRYRLSSQLLWSHIRGVVDESVAKDVQEARTGVDFFVCLVYMSMSVGSLSVAGLLFGEGHAAALIVALVVGVLAAAGSYLAAVTATDAWASSVRGMVDLARLPLARALGLQMPATLAEERDMWEKVGWLLGYAYHEQAATVLDLYRTVPREEDAE